MRLSLALVLMAACSPLTEPDGPGGPAGPVRATAIEPAIGSVAGGTRVAITGSGFHEGIAVEVGPAACTDVAIDSDTRLSCTTGSSDFVEDKVDVAVIGGDERAVLEYAFEYVCPWTTSTGRRSCGAAPPEPVAVQPISAWVIEEAQPLAIATDGSGATSVASVQVPATDMRNSQLKIWLRVQGLDHAQVIDVQLGNRGLSNRFTFRLRSGQGQQWITEGDLVAFTVSWSPENVISTGAPDRAAIEEIAFHVADDATGNPVHVTVGGVALVPEPTGEFPNGLLSFTFDDNWSMMPDIAAVTLGRHDFPATAYVIIDYIGKQDRATHDQLHDLQLHGWDIAVHAFTGAHHDARFPTLPAEVVEDDLVDARAWLMRYGFHGHHHCAYPGGDFSYGGATVLPIVGRYFTSCRTIFQRQREAWPPSDPLKLRVLYVTSGTSRAAVELAVDRARDHHEWIILVFHKLVSGEPALTTEWKTSDFEQVVEHVAASGIEVATVSSALAR